MNALTVTLSAAALLVLTGCSDDSLSLVPENPIMPDPVHPIEPEKSNPVEAVPERPIEDVEGESIAPDLAMLGPALMIPSEDGTEFVLRFVDGQHIKEEAFVTELLPSNLNQSGQEAAIQYLTSTSSAESWPRLLRAQWGHIAEYSVNSDFSGTWLRAKPEYELVLPAYTRGGEQWLEFEHLGDQDYTVMARIQGLSGAGDIASPDCHLMGQLHRRTNEAGYIGELVGASCVNLSERHHVQGYIVARTVEGQVSMQLHAELHRGADEVRHFGGDFLSQ
ncbi:hypothetical protein KUV89_00370 [Marinobacter hydrocarbonoclasticus]|nr:hypothetical protein [Marinobacter nauticus]